MNDADIYDRIRALVAEEHEVRDDPEVETALKTDAVRRIEEALDQCWDLLRQRRALRDSGGDAAAAQARPVDEVEGYRQ